jgi:hypothetical protein
MYNGDVVSVPTLADRGCRVVSATNPHGQTSGGGLVGIVRWRTKAPVFFFVVPLGCEPHIRNLDHCQNY